MAAVDVEARLSRKFGNGRNESGRVVWWVWVWVWV